MALNYQLHRSNRNDQTKGLWYARAVHTGTVDIDQLADLMQNNCTVKRADILAVISELVEVMTNQLQDSKIVKLDRLGSFKVSMSSEGVEQASDWKVTKHLKGMRILFTPERKRDATSGSYTRALLSGIKVKEQNFYDVDSSKASADGDAADGGDSTDNTADTAAGE